MVTPRRQARRARERIRQTGYAGSDLVAPEPKEIICIAALPLLRFAVRPPTNTHFVQTPMAPVGRSRVPANGRSRENWNRRSADRKAANESLDNAS